MPESLMPELLRLEEEYSRARSDPAFTAELNQILREFVGRPTLLYRASRFARLLKVAGVEVYLKREDLTHTGGHCINNAVGQALLALRLGKTRIVAETGAGQHGVAAATACAILGLDCVVYMGAADIARQPFNVDRMRLLGARVHPILHGRRGVKEATTEAVRDWVTTLDSTHFLFGTVTGPAPYPQIVRDFQTVIGTETRGQLLATEARLPDLMLACVGGGSNAIGLFHPFLADAAVRLVGVEAAGRGDAAGQHAATLTHGSPGVSDGTYSYLLQDEDGQISPTHSIAAGLDISGVGSELSYLKDSGRVQYRAVSDSTALRGMYALSRTEGIIAALEPAHALGALLEMAERGELAEGMLIVLGLSGRGDKDTAMVAATLGDILPGGPAAVSIAT
ncbi:tryptophan synthase subunit beta [Nocardia heshunensis]